LQPELKFGVSMKVQKPPLLKASAFMVWRS
jgi:hypothetical protein